MEAFELSGAGLTLNESELIVSYEKQPCSLISRSLSNVFVIPLREHWHDNKRGALSRAPLCTFGLSHVGKWS